MLCGLQAFIERLVTSNDGRSCVSNGIGLDMMMPFRHDYYICLYIFVSNIITTVMLIVTFTSVTSVEVELPQQLKSIGKPLVLAIFGSELAILTAFCCFIFICRLLHASHE